MTVHARGYRPYVGAFGGAPAWWVILRANLAVVGATKAMKVLNVLLIVLACVFGMLLYVQVSLGERILARALQSDDPAELLRASRVALLTALRIYYSAATTVVSLLAILTGAGLVADDLRARSLTLMMVRPIRPFDYALGKALVLPWFLVTRAGAPGLLMWLLVGAWQPPGQTQPFWEATADVPGLLATHLLLSAGSYAGLTLLLSAGTSRRGVASALAAAVIFGGLVIRSIGMQMKGTLGESLRLASLGTNVLHPITRAHWEALPSFRRQDWLLERMPDPAGAAWLAGALFCLGFLRVWWRARSVEVTE